jgi:hypothetical protein
MPQTHDAIAGPVTVKGSPMQKRAATAHETLMQRQTPI